MLKIMVVEDDLYLREELTHTFQKNGYIVENIVSFLHPEKEILLANPDLIVLDINLPGQSGLQICQWLKSHTSLPILILTAQDTLHDELAALNLGADDFLTKPCHPDRLLARVNRLLQTYGKIKNIVQYGPLILDIDTYKLSNKEQSLILPETEGKILKILLINHPHSVSQETLIANIWGTSEFVDPNILQVNIARLRKNLTKIGAENFILTIRGEGYQLKGLEL